MSEGQHNAGYISSRDPALGNKGLPSSVVVEKVEGLVDQLLFGHGVLPTLHRVRDLQQLGLPRRLGPVQHMPNIFKASRDLAQSIVTLVRIRVDGIECGTHRFCNLANLGEESVAVSEDDEDVLPGLRAGGRVDEDLLDIGVVHVEVATENTP